jgi:hypothetical protein
MVRFRRRQNNLVVYVIGYNHWETAMTTDTKDHPTQLTAGADEVLQAIARAIGPNARARDIVYLQDACSLLRKNTSRFAEPRREDCHEN